MGRRTRLLDAVTALALLTLGELEALTGAFATHRTHPAWAQALAAGVAAGALLWRSRAPRRVVHAVVAALALLCVLAGSPEGLTVFAVPLVAAYSVALHAERRGALLALGEIVLLGLVWIAFDPMNASAAQAAGGVAWISPWVMAWLLGAYRRTRRLYVEGLIREREERAVAAVAEERNRIARELHDVIGHSVSVMTVQASAVRRVLRAEQSRERAALESVESTGRQALGELRRMVAVLRSSTSAADLAPPPSLDQLERLLETFRSAGLAVELRREGIPEGLPPGLQLTAYRLVQEGLTNTLKHAAARQAVVEVHVRDGLLHVAVTDDGTAQPPDSGGGHGLAGMRERVAVYGGSLTAGRLESAGYALRAELPLAAP